MRPRPGRRLGVAVLAALALSAAAGPALSPYDPLAIDPTRSLEAPSLSHPMGTDGLGRDVLVRVLSGARRSLGAGLVATLIAVTIGVGLGAISGVAHRGIDVLLARFADTVNAFPALVGALALFGVGGAGALPVPPGLRAGAVVGLFAWPSLYRYVRAEVRRLVSGDLAAAARAAGAGPWRTALRHLVPQVLSAALVPAAFLAAGAVGVEAALGFLGLGAPPPEPSWGGLLREAMSYVGSAWWLAVFPGACLFLTVLGCHFFGEGLSRERDA